MNKELLDFEGLKIQLASPEKIRNWSHGEVTEAETINYRTLKPEKDGLFCERIFGPTKDYECYCGKYKRIRYKGIVCDKCGVEVTNSRVRRERMGHINLAAPVAHIWYFKSIPSKLSLLLDIPPKNLSSVIYFSKYLVLEVDEEKQEENLETIKNNEKEAISKLEEKAKEEIEKIKNNLEAKKEVLEEKDLDKKEYTKKLEELKLESKKDIEKIREQLALDKEASSEIYKKVKKMARNIHPGIVISEDEYLKLREYSATSHLKVGMGAEAILEYMQDLDLQETTKELKENLKSTNSKNKRKKFARRLKVVAGIKNAGLDPRWTILKVLPVLPPDLRPMVQLSGGRFAASDLNDLYRRVIHRNNRLRHLIDLGAPEIILRNEKRMLQESVDSLIDSSRARTRRRRRKELKSLSDMLSGKQGRFRRNLLGKRVDYSGRSVIVVGPNLRMDQCGLPKDMALEMFKPYVIRELIERGISPNIKSAKHTLERKGPEVYDILEEVTKDHPVLLNRAPTLHKLGIQAFYPVLTEGSAIQIHPCICAGYNADFDGDQMAVHVPLSEKAIDESEGLMLPKNNLLKPANGSPITVPNKDMALGCYYLTTKNSSLEPSKTIYTDPEEVDFALQADKLDLRQEIKVRIDGDILTTTPGRIIFNKALPEIFDFINNPVGAKDLVELVKKAIDLLDKEEVTEIVDRLKEIGFYYLTKSGLSVSMSDNVMIDNKNEMIKEAEERVSEIQETYNQGLITEEERRRLSFDVWMDTTDKIAENTWEAYDESNSVKLIIESGGTRASKDQVKQLSAMRGLVVDPMGKIVEMPTKSNFREGLSIFEYVTSSRGSRKGLTDSALKTADAGYLTRRLVDVSHNSIIREEDCGTDKYLEMKRSGSREKYLKKRILGRTAGKDIHDESGKMLVEKGDTINEDVADDIVESDVETIPLYSPLTCESRYGLCTKCYGWDFSNRKPAHIGTPVGVIAAQSIGEPGTQLTMRTKHSAGIVGQDVTQGLPRVEELFEARTPKVLSPIATISGKAEVEEVDDGYKVTLKATSDEAAKKEEKHHVPQTLKLKVENGDLVAAGSKLAEGPMDPEKVLKVRGMRGAQKYLLKEIQKVYESQGIHIADVHFETVIRQMSNKLKIEQTGDTRLIPGEVVEQFVFEEENEQILAEGGEPATAKNRILGITKSSLYTHSWLSAASFQETKNVLAEASLEGKEDPLYGLKENVIIGRLIPTTKERAKMKTQS